MQTVVHEIHEELEAHFDRHTEVAGFGEMRLQSGLNGAGTLYMTQVQAKRLADAIYTNLGLSLPT